MCADEKGQAEGRLETRVPRVAEPTGDGSFAYCVTVATPVAVLEVLEVRRREATTPTPPCPTQS
jgi:hypothetical protein